ncbi:MAG: DUF6305 family protein [Synergistaceae bacterium]|jgi:hypothetical protein|nr:DUF6305 family protein [Synergistaceae bacterium]
MYRKIVYALLFVSVVLLSGVAGEGSAAASEIALTSIGQSPDAVMVNVVLKRMKVAADYNATMKEADLAGHKILIAVVGGSSKGLGAAGIDRDQELARGIALVNAAKSQGLKALVMHVGGEGRRGELSDMFVEGVFPLADALIVVKGANADGLFDRVKPASATVLEADGIQTVGGSIETVLKEWGLAL